MTAYLLVASPYVLVVSAQGKTLVSQSLLVDNAVSKFQAKCRKIGFQPNIVDGRIMIDSRPQVLAK